MTHKQCFAIRSLGGDKRSHCSINLGHGRCNKRARFQLLVNTPTCVSYEYLCLRHRDLREERLTCNGFVKVTRTEWEFQQALKITTDKVYEAITQPPANENENG